MIEENVDFGVVQALISLAPGAKWTMVGRDYSGVDWEDEEVDQPSEEEVLNEVSRLRAEYDGLRYQRLRAAEYPPMADYLDGIVKNDQQQIQTYIDVCQAVKNKYPKPRV